MASTPRILLVEDLPDDAEASARAIRSALGPCVFRRADNPDDLPDALAAFSPDLVVSELRIPRLDGARVLGIVADRAAGTPTIIVTSAANEDAAIACVKAGAAGYALKGHPERIGTAAWGALDARRAGAARLGASEALRESEERYRQLVESAHDWVWEVDASGVYTYAGPQVRTLLGYAPDEIVGKTPFDLMPPDEAARVGQLFAEIVGRQQPFSGLENVNQHRDGRLVILETNGVPVFDGAGQFRGYRGMDRDITERRRSREALRMSEEKFAKAFHASPDSININRLSDGRYVDVNPGFLAQTGYERDEVIGRTSIEIDLWANPEDRERLTQGLARDGQVDNLQASFRLKSGSVRVGQMSARIMTIGGEPHIVSVTRDIHDQKCAEEALQKSEQRFRRITESMTDLVAEADREGRYRYVSPSFRAVLGIEPATLIGEWVFARVHPDDLPAVLATYAASVEDGAARSVEFRYRHADGRYLWFQTSGQLLFDADGVQDGFVVSSRDITDRRLVEAEKEALQGQLLQAQKMESVGRLAGGVAHDFNNMLGVIMGHAELALMEPGTSTAICADLEEILAAGRRSADLTRQLLAFARKQAIRPKVLDLDAAVAGTLKMLRRLIGEDIALVYTPVRDLWRVRIDPSQVDEILANLVVNARDAMANAGTLSIGTANVVFDETYCANHLGSVPGEHVLLAVSDTGVGMSREVLDRAFEPFFTTKAAGLGTGLGLSTVYGVVKQNEGFITVQSEPATGTTVKIFLPRAGAGEDVSSPSMTADDTPTGKETVLIVEDAHAMLELGRSMLIRLGYAVLTARSPSDAIRIATEHAGPIHLLLTDVVMPDMNGKELAARLTAIKPALKCLFMSGYTADIISSHGVIQDAVHFVQKPFTMSALAQGIRKAIDRLETP